MTITRQARRVISSVLRFGARLALLWCSFQIGVDLAWLAAGAYVQPQLALEALVALSISGGLVVQARSRALHRVAARRGVSASSC